MKALYRELRRRKVMQTCILYVVACWGVLQIIDLLFPLLELQGDELSRYLFGAAIAGFPLAFALAWVFQITPEGIVRSSPFVERRVLSNIPPVNDRRETGVPRYFRKSEVPESYAWTLTAETGPLVGLSFGIDRSLVLGRSVESDIAVVSPHVSRQHARLDIDGGQLTIEDLGSSNGTVINGRPLNGRCTLQSEDEIRFHDIVFRVTGSKGYSYAEEGLLSQTTFIQNPDDNDPDSFSGGR
ncbi:FHA domain-containing protein [Kineobactrum sediminis]|nr:FHA domain-containing protein [Kineobactrum sediminis]